MRAGTRAVLVALWAIALPAAATPTEVTLLHVNDTHSRLAPWGPKDANLDGTLGGLTKAATIILGEKASAPNALFVHGGDLFHGDLFFEEYLGVPELQVLQSLGLDVLVPGNHEFQFGPEFLAGVLAATWPDGGAFSIVGTNLDLTGYPILGTWISPRVIKDVNGVKVGFFGLTTPFDPLEQPAPVAIGTDLTGISYQAVADLRADGAQVVVCLAHLGLDLSRMLAAEVPGIDVIVNGHDHAALAQPEAIPRPLGGTTYLVSAGEYYRWVGRLRLTVEGDQVALVDYALLGVDAGTPALPEVQAVVTWLQAGIVARYGDVFHQPLATAVGPIPNAWEPGQPSRDTATGDLFTDAYRAWTGTDIAVEAVGFLDQGLPEGPVVAADLYRSMGYGLPELDPATGQLRVRPFQLATFRISGAQLIAALEIGLTTPGGLFPQVSGMRFDFDSRRPPFQMVLLDSVKVGGGGLEPDAVYTATASEGLIMFLPALGIEISDVQILSEPATAAVGVLVEQRGLIGPATDGRIRDVAAIPLPPVAEAGPDQSLYTGDTAVLAGTATSPDGAAMATWAWAVVDAPSGGTWQLSFADGATAQLQVLSPGDYVLSLRVTDVNGNASAPDFVTIHAASNLPPVAVVTTGATSGPAPLTVCLDGTQSSDPEGAPLLYDWDLGDGQARSASPTVCHTYQAPGQYTVALTVVDVRNAADTEVLTITALPPENHPPVVSPVATPQTGPAPLVVQLTANATDIDADPLAYAWTFGDGTGSDAMSPSHTYATAGTYAVWLTVSDGKASASASLTIVVNAPVPVIELNVTRADVDFKSRKSTLAQVVLQAELYASVPGPDDIVALFLDGDRVFAAPFGQFVLTREHGRVVPGVYKLKAKDLWVVLDFVEGRLVVDADKVLLPAYNPANGVDVEVMLGEATAVDNVQPVDEKCDRHYRHHRPERGRGNCHR